MGKGAQSNLIGSEKMVEHLRKFTVSFYSDSNKSTNTKTFDLDDYESTDGMIADIEALLNVIKEEGVLSAF